MSEINIANWDPQSRADFDDAIDLANRFWRSIGEDKALHIDTGPPPRLVFTYEGRRHHIRLLVEGMLFRTADRLTTPVAVSFRRRIRFRGRDRCADPAVTQDARNSLFLWADGTRRTSTEIYTLLVHELTHTQQQLNSVLGSFSFGLGYLLSGGIFHEWDADRMEERARDFAARNTGTVSVTITGPTVLRKGQSGTYVATGSAPHGVYDWDPAVGHAKDGLYAKGTGSALGRSELVVRAESDEGTATLVVTFRQGANSATASFRVTLQP